MDLRPFMACENEKPLDHLVSDGGFVKIFRTIGCIGDSLSSGEFQGRVENGRPSYHDFYEYSWGQYMAREAGCTVYNFSKGGMTASDYVQTFAEQRGFWDEKLVCQAYILALGVNDLFGRRQELGSVEDIQLTQRSEKTTFAAYYGTIIQRLKTKQPDAKFFLMTMPRDEDEAKNEIRRRHAELLYGIRGLMKNIYILDLYQYAPVYDKAFKENFYLDGHMNPAGYILTAKMVMSYIDWIIRRHPEDFAQVAFIGKPYHNLSAKW